MSKIGRNSPCPCGSGKKYKKCCIDKPDPVATSKGILNHLKNFISYEEVNAMGTGEIIQRLESMGIVFNKDKFLQDVQEYYAAQQIKDSWFEDFAVTAEGRDEDFPFFAAWILWERLAPKQILSMEQMEDLIDKGFRDKSNGDSIGACDIWLKVWDALKYRLKPEIKSLDCLEKQYEGSFFIKNFCQDLEEELHNAGLKDQAYFEKRINYCQEFISYFPEEDELIIHNMRRSIAESYARLGSYAQADLEFKRLVEDYPNNPWGYIGWGDIYFLEKNKNITRAKELYNKASLVVKNKFDAMALEERLTDLVEEEKADDYFGTK